MIQNAKARRSTKGGNKVDAAAGATLAALRASIREDAITALEFAKPKLTKLVLRKVSEHNKADIDVLAPEGWSDIAVKMIATKYMRRAGVPSATVPVLEDGIPEQFARRVPAPGATFGRENSAEQVIERLAGAWTYWALRTKTKSGERLFDAETAEIFFRSIKTLLLAQVFAPNSPQWFNTGLHWAYGIDSKGSGHFNIDPETQDIVASDNTYERPQAHACFINGVEDDLVGDMGILDLWMREARIFKLGSGSGANYSRLRGKGEKLSGGGVSSGMMSFLRTGDANAGSIASGGTTRRAARMIVVDVDHPEVVEYVDWKSVEERKVAALISGSTLNAKHARAIIDAHKAGESTDPAYEEALRAGVPQGFLDQVIGSVRDGQEFPIETYDTDWQGEAYKTVNGQNANNTVRVDDAFMKAVIDNDDYALTARRDGSVMRTLKADDLWSRIAYNAWMSADPGLHFKDAINDWHTCKASGEIRASNPCSEYLFLDDTGCNLASARLTAFLKGDRSIDVAPLESLSRLMALILETTVTMAQYPSRAIATRTRDTRTLGMGFMDIGGQIMKLGLPYDSDEGRKVAAAQQSLMCAAGYAMSGRLATVLGAFPFFEANREHVGYVMGKHLAANENLADFAKTDIAKGGSFGQSLKALIERAQENWVEAVAATAKDGMRNAQMSAIAPTGTIGLVTDSDTTGIEPDFALMKFKSLAGGGYMMIENQAVEPALKVLGYSDNERGAIIGYLRDHKNLEGCELLKPEHLAVFDTANINSGGTRFIAPEAHVKMMAAVQPFTSGAISKTVNMPGSSTVQDIKDIYMLAWRMGLKAIAIYRDGSKMSAPLQSALADKVFGEQAAEVRTAVATKDVQALARIMAEEMLRDRSSRKPLPGKRNGYTQKAKVGEHKIFLTTGEYEDGTLGEIYINMHKEGAAFRAMMNNFAIAISLGLQHGVPLERYVEAFTFTRFEPAGAVRGHDRIKNATSIIDYVFRDLAVNYLGRDDLAHVEIVHEATEVGPGYKEGYLPEPTEAMIEAFAPKSEPVAEKHDPRKEGYTGDTCQNCNSTRVKRDGKCAICEECGTSVGGCV